MLSPAQYLVIFGVLLNGVGTFFYIRGILRGGTKPNKMTFLMWSIAPLIGGVAAIFSGATWAVVPVIAAGVLPLIVLLVSMRTPQSYWKLRRSDYVCGTLSALALILWLATNEPNIAIVFAILSDGFATAPTLVKAWRHPETEVGWTYFISSFNGLTGIIVATRLSFAQVAFPVYLFLMMGAIGVAATRRRKA